MLVVISPAKKLDFETPCNWQETTKPSFHKESLKLVDELKKLDPNEISSLMKLSADLSKLNYERYQMFKPKHNTSLSKQAAFAFNGDTYTGLNIQNFSKKELEASNERLRILSGLYGVLRPSDLIQPYRLEMGTKFKFDDYKNLYQFWDHKVTETLNSELDSHKYLLNCASNEYFKVIKTKTISTPIITPQFRDYKNGEYKMISFFAKKARGMMAAFTVRNKITELSELRKFNEEGYQYNKELTQDELAPVFTRKL